MARERDRFRAQIEDAHDQIVSNLPLLVETALDIATGVLVEETDRDGETRTYRKEPNPAMLEYLMNRVMGKPTEHLIVSKTVSVEDLILDAARQALEARGEVMVLDAPQIAPDVDTVEGEVRVLTP
jgi:hypothetical protein